MADPHLDVELHHRLGRIDLDVRLAVGRETLALIGPSGVGKSSVLRAIAGLLKPKRGRIVCDGRPLLDTQRRVDLPPEERRVGLVFQDGALFPHLSVEANVAYGLNGLDRLLRAARVEEMLSLVDGTELAARLPRDLSGGQAQRVALARALAPSPRLLLLDEPFSALDGVASDALISRLQSWLLQNKVQTVIATHDATAAFSTGAEVALLHEGRLAAQGAASQVLATERARLLSRLQ